MSDWINDENCLGHLLGYGVQHALCPNEYLASTGIACLRQLWPKIEPYFQRRIIVDIEVALHMVDRKPIALEEEWRKLRDELRGPKHPFTVKYVCGKCGTEGLKLWRGVHGCADKDGNELLCATCLAPGIVVGDDGRHEEKTYGRTDQVKGWLPAVPVDDTFWGYTSVPSQDVDWWRALPTYAATPKRSTGRDP